MEVGSLHESGIRKIAALSKRRLGKAGAVLELGVEEVGLSKASSPEIRLLCKAGSFKANVISKDAIAEQCLAIEECMVEVAGHVELPETEIDIREYESSEVSRMASSSREHSVYFLQEFLV